MTLKLNKENPLGTKVQTRDGKKARLLCVDLDHKTYTIAAAIVGRDGVERLRGFTQSGGVYECAEHKNDLVNVPEEHEAWVNVYSGLGVSCQYPSREFADKYARADRKACLHIKFKEGEGLND